MSTISSTSTQTTKQTQTGSEALKELDRNLYKKSRDRILEASNLNPTGTKVVKIVDDIVQGAGKSKEAGPKIILDGVASVVENMTDAVLLAAVPMAGIVSKTADLVDQILPSTISVPEDVLPSEGISYSAEFLNGLSHEGSSVSPSLNEASREQVLLGVEVIRFLRGSVHDIAHPTQTVSEKFISLLEALPQNVRLEIKADQLITFFKEEGEGQFKNSIRELLSDSCVKLAHIVEECSQQEVNEAESMAYITSATERKVQQAVRGFVSFVEDCAKQTSNQPDIDAYTAKMTQDGINSFVNWWGNFVKSASQFIQNAKDKDESLVRSSLLAYNEEVNAAIKSFTEASGIELQVGVTSNGGSYSQDISLPTVLLEEEGDNPASAAEQRCNNIVHTNEKTKEEVKEENSPRFLPSDIVDSIKKNVEAGVYDAPGYDQDLPEDFPRLIGGKLTISFAELSQARQFARIVDLMQTHGWNKKYAEEMTDLRRRSKHNLDEDLKKAGVEDSVAAASQRKVLIQAILAYNNAVKKHETTGKNAHSVSDALCTLVVEKESYDTWVKGASLLKASKEGGGMPGLDLLDEGTLRGKIKQLSEGIHTCEKNIEGAKERYDRYKRKTNWWRKVKRFGTRTWYELGFGRHPNKVAEDEAYKVHVNGDQKKKLEGELALAEKQLDDLLKDRFEKEKAVEENKKAVEKKEMEETALKEVKEQKAAAKEEEKTSSQAMKHVQFEPKVKTAQDLLIEKMARDMTAEVRNILPRKASNTSGITSQVSSSGIPFSSQSFAMPSSGGGGLPDMRTPFTLRDARILNAHNSISQAFGNGSRFPGRFVADSSGTSVRFKFDDPQTSTFQMPRAASSSSQPAAAEHSSTGAAPVRDYELEARFSSSRGGSGDGPFNRFIQGCVVFGVVMTKKTVRGVHDLFSKQEFLHNDKVEAHGESLKSTNEFLESRQMFIPLGGHTSCVKGNLFVGALHDTLAPVGVLWGRRIKNVEEARRIYVREKALHDAKEQDTTKYRVSFHEGLTTAEKFFYPQFVDEVKPLLENIERADTEIEEVLKAGAALVDGANAAQLAPLLVNFRNRFTSRISAHALYAAGLNQIENHQISLDSQSSSFEALARMYIQDISEDILKGVMREDFSKNARGEAFIKSFSKLFTQFVASEEAVIKTQQEHDAKGWFTRICSTVVYDYPQKAREEMKTAKENLVEKIKELHQNILLQSLKELQEPLPVGGTQRVNSLRESKRLLCALLQGEEITLHEKRMALSLLPAISRSPFFTLNIPVQKGNRLTEEVWLRGGVPQRLFFDNPQTPEVYAAKILLYRESL